MKFLSTSAVVCDELWMAGLPVGDRLFVDRESQIFDYALFAAAIVNRPGRFKSFSTTLSLMNMLPSLHICNASYADCLNLLTYCFIMIVSRFKHKKGVYKMKNLHVLYLAIVLQLGGGMFFSTAHASTTGSICYGSLCVHCIDGFCVSCDLGSGSCAPISQE